MASNAARLGKQPESTMDRSVTTSPSRPATSIHQPTQEQARADGPSKKKKKRRKKRRQSFMALDRMEPVANGNASRDSFNAQAMQSRREGFYRGSGGRNLSNESLDSERLLDHR